MQSNKIKLKKSCFYPKEYVRFIPIVVPMHINMLVNIFYRLFFSVKTVVKFLY